MKNVLSVKCFISEISKGGWFLYKKERRLIGIFNWIKEYTLFSGRIWFLTSSFRAVPFQKVVKIFFPAFKGCLSMSLPAKKKNQPPKHLKFTCLEKYCPEVWNQIQEISCWKHLFSLQDRGSDRCIYFKRKVLQPVCSTAWKKTLITPTSVAVERETCQLKWFLCKE